MMPNHRLATGVKIALAVLCLFTVAVFVLRLRLRASASPRVQNGLTFVTQHTGGSQSAPRTLTHIFFQWVNAHLFPTGSYVSDMETPCVEIAMPKGTTTGQFHATARASTGDTFALASDDWMAASHPAQSRAPHTFVRLPNVPATYAWIDCYRAG